jgi:hypothetical protein
MRPHNRLLATLATDTFNVAAITACSLMMRPTREAIQISAVAATGLALAYPAVFLERQRRANNRVQSRTRSGVPRALILTGLTWNTLGAGALALKGRTPGTGRWSIPVLLLLVGDRLSLSYLSAMQKV